MTWKWTWTTWSWMILTLQMLTLMMTSWMTKSTPTLSRAYLNKKRDQTPTPLLYLYGNILYCHVCPPERGIEVDDDNDDISYVLF